MAFGSRDYVIEYEVKKGSRWLKDGSGCVARTGTGAIRRWRGRGGKGLRVRNVKARRLNTYYGAPI